MSKDGKDAELMKLTEEDCALIRDALRLMKQQFYRAKGEMPFVTEDFRAFFDAQEATIDTVKEKVWLIQRSLIDQRYEEEWEKEIAERV